MLAIYNFILVLLAEPLCAIFASGLKWRLVSACVSCVREPKSGITLGV